MLRTRYQMRDKKQEKGLTLVELLVAMIVTGIVLTAVATLAFAMGTANKSSDDVSAKQAQLRFATLKIQELVRNSRLVCFFAIDNIALWISDDNNNGQINIGELVYIDSGQSGDYIRLCQFSSTDNTAINPGSIGTFDSNWWSAYPCDIEYMLIIPECADVQFSLDNEIQPLQSEFVSISLKMVENGISHLYQINSCLRGRSENLLDGFNIVSDDD